MTLEFLKTKDRQTANGILAAAALETSSIAQIDTGLQLVRRYETEAAKVVAEIRSKLNLAPNDFTAEALRAIDQYLLNEMQKAFLGKSEENDALARAARAGQLAPSLYKISETPRFKDLFPSMGIRISHAEDAVRNPHDLEHLYTDDVAVDAQYTISLFVKAVVSRRANSNHWLLVQTHRVGIEQVIQSAWRILPDDVDLIGARSPLDILERFVKVFGTSFKISGKDEFFIRKDFREGHASLKMEFKNDQFLSVSLVRSKDRKGNFIGPAYSIDIVRYRKSLENRGMLALA